MSYAIEVRSVLDEITIAGLQIIAGSAGLNRPVGAVRLTVSTEELAEAGEHELVMTTWSALSAAGRPEDRLSELATGGVAALLLRLDQNMQVHEEVVAAASQTNLPLLGYPSDFEPGAVRVAALEALLEAQRGRLHTVLEAYAGADERFAALTLEELVAGGDDSTEQLVERAAALGWDLHRPRAVLLASIDPSENGPIPANALNTIAAAARATLGADAIVWTRTSTIAALVAPNTASSAERRAIAEALRSELDARLSAVPVSIGVGRTVGTPEDIPRSFDEASRAVEVGRWAKGRHVTEVFDELGLERLFAATPTDDLGEFVETAIGPLLRRDSMQRSELVETFAIWLETRNMAEAARRMHVHYNTLKNRLERIEEILGPVIADPGRALECEVAIYVHRHYDVDPATGSP